MTRINITYLKALNCAASTQEKRFYLCGVLVECRDRSVTYAATDGHVLLSAHDALDDETDANTVLGHFIIPSDAIAKMKLNKRGSYSDFEPMTQGPDGTLILCGQAFKPIDGTFPDWRRVLPKGGETNDAGKPPNHYDPPVAMRLHTAAEIVNGRRTNALIRICPAPEGFPAAVELSGGALPWFGVIMGIRRDNTPWHRPDWVSTSVETQPVLQAAE